MESEKKKKSGGKIAAVILMAAIAIFLLSWYFDFGEDDSAPEYMSFTTISAMDSMTLEWKQHDDVQYYEIFRKDITDDFVEDDVSVSRDQYTRLDMVEDGQHKYTDRNVEFGHCYAYVIDGYHKSFGRIKHICSSYEDGSVEYDTVGLAKPELLNNGEGENHENSKSKIFLYLQCIGGLEPTGAVLYRKSSEDDTYKTVDYKILGDGKINSGCELLDKTVKPGETYTYKIRTSIEEGGQTYYSQDSRTVTIPAVNFKATYEVKAMTEAWSGDEEAAKDHTFVIEVTSEEDNGDTVFIKKPKALYRVSKDKEGKKLCDFNAKLVGYSTEYAEDQTQWESVPKEGVTLPAGENLYLQYELSQAKESPDDSVETPAELFFGGDEAACSKLIMDGDASGGAEYHGPGYGNTIMSLDLVKKKGTAYCDFD